MLLDFFFFFNLMALVIIIVCPSCGNCECSRLLWETTEEDWEDETTTRCKHGLLLKRWLWMLLWLRFYRNWTAFLTFKESLINSTEGFSRGKTCFQFTPDWLWQDLAPRHRSRCTAVDASSNTSRCRHAQPLKLSTDQLFGRSCKSRVPAI